MSFTRRSVIPSVIIVVAAAALWPFVDRTETRITFCATGLCLLLAWYSILDLQEQRKEHFWPHTFDRLVRATFTAVTLVFVFDLAVRPAEETVLPPPPPPQQVRVPFDADVFELVKNGTFDTPHLQEVVNRHFGQCKLADGSVTMTVADRRNRFTLVGRGSVVGTVP